MFFLQSYIVKHMIAFWRFGQRMCRNYFVRQTDLTKWQHVMWGALCGVWFAKARDEMGMMQSWVIGERASTSSWTSFSLQLQGRMQYAVTPPATSPFSPSDGRSKKSTRQLFKAQPVRECRLQLRRAWSRHMWRNKRSWSLVLILEFWLGL